MRILYYILSPISSRVASTLAIMIGITGNQIPFNHEDRLYTLILMVSLLLFM